MIPVLIIMLSVFATVNEILPTAQRQLSITSEHGNYAGLYGAAADGAQYGLWLINASLDEARESILSGDLDEADAIALYEAAARECMRGEPMGLSYEITGDTEVISVDISWKIDPSTANVTIHIRAKRDRGGKKYTLALDGALVLTFPEIDEFVWEMVNLRKNEGA